MRTTPLLALLAGCVAPDPGEAFTDLDIAPVTEASAVNSRFVDVAVEAERTLHVALPGLSDPDLADAIVAAWDRGVEVAVVTDADQADDAGVALLLEAGVPLRLADGAVTYFEFTLNGPVAWSSDQAQMTHAFIVGDGTRVALATAAGHVDDRPAVVFAGHSEELGEDLISEHVQVFGGVDATALTAFDSPAKSIADARWSYPTQSDDMLELWLGPQERVVKRLIDAVYAARSSIRVLTDDLADEGLALALQRKAEDGFDVEVLVGRRFATTNPALSQVLLDQAPDVPLLRATTDAVLPTVVYIDYDRARDGRFHMGKALVATHPVWSAARLSSGAEVVTDQLCDGALVVVTRHGEPGDNLIQLAGLYQDARATAEDLR